MPTSKPKPVEIIPAAEANRRFSELLRGVREEGRSYIVTNHGRAVAQISAPPDASESEAARRQAAYERLLDHLENSPGLKIEPWTREELYERGRRD